MKFSLTKRIRRKEGPGDRGGERRNDVESDSTVSSAVSRGSITCSVLGCLDLVASALRNIPMLPSRK